MPASLRATRTDRGALRRSHRSAGTDVLAECLAAFVAYSSFTPRPLDSTGINSGTDNRTAVIECRANVAMLVDWINHQDGALYEGLLSRLLAKYWQYPAAMKSAIENSPDQ